MRTTLLDDGAFLDHQIGPGPPPGGVSYDCKSIKSINSSGANAVCVQAASASGGAPKLNATCDNKCDPLTSTAWLALKEYFRIDHSNSNGSSGSDANTTMKCIASKDTYLKKSELNSKNLPVSELLPVKQGQTFQLSGWADLGDEYYWVQL